jgi:hypothetical protein
MQMRLSAEISSVVWRPVQSGTKFTWRHFLDAYNYSSYALPLSGGTMTGSVTFPTNTYNYIGQLALIVMPSAPSTLQLRTTSSDIMSAISFHKSTDWYGTLTADTDSNLRWNDNIVVHSGNIGSHKAGDSTKLGGIDADRYMLGHNPYAVDADYIFDLSYHSVANGFHLPSSSQHGSLLTMPYRKTAGNSTPDFGTQIFIPNGDDAKPYMWFRTSLGSKWNSWRKVVSEEANGNVLIGTTTDNGYKLDINGGSLRLCSNVGSSNDTLAGFYTYSANPFGVQFRVNTSSGNTYIQARREGKAEYFNMLLQPDGGNVLIGTTTDNGDKLQVQGTVRIALPSSSTDAMFYGQRTDLGYSIGLGIGTSSNRGIYDNTLGWCFKIDTSNNLSIVGHTVTGNLVATGEVTSGSDARYKRIDSHVDIDLETIANAPIINFKWTDREDNRVHLGSTAQYWYNTSLLNGVIPTDNEKLWTMGYGQIALASVVSVAKKVVNHEERVKILEKRVNELENELNEYRRVS